MVKLENDKSTLGKREIICLLLFGFFAFSPFSTYLLMDILHFPFSAPELFLIPFLFLLKKRVLLLSINIYALTLFLWCLFLLLILSVLWGVFPLNSLLGTLRIYLYMFFCMSCSNKSQGIALDSITYISIGTIVGWIVCSYLTISLYLNGDSETVAVCGNMLGIPLAILIPALKKQYRIFLIVLFLCLILSLMSGMRRQILIFLESIFLFFLFTQWKEKKKIMAIVGCLIFMITVCFGDIESYMKEEVPVLYYRVFDKTEQFISGDTNDADSGRTDNFYNFITDIDEYVLPHGFVSRDTLNHEVGKFIDFPLSELFYTLGYGAIVLLLWLLLMFYRVYRLSRRYNIINLKVYMSMAIVMFSLLFLEGTFLSSSYTVPFTGYCLGQLYYNSWNINLERISSEKI